MKQYVLLVPIRYTCVSRAVPPCPCAGIRVQSVITMESKGQVSNDDWNLQDALTESQVPAEIMASTCVN